MNETRWCFAGNMRRLAGAAAVAALVVSAALPAAADKTFPAPTGWDHVGQSTANGNETSDVYENGSGDLKERVTIFSDSAASYDTVVGRIHKNVTDNKMKVNIDKDQTCDGKTSRLIELLYGPALKRVLVDRLVVPNGDGTVQITYTRPEAAPYDDSVKAAFTTYCGA